MSPELLKYSRIMRIVVLSFFIGYLLWKGTTLTYVFAAFCVLFLAGTCFQLWQASKSR